jgi:uncharacterized glyoxalase superfamily protein PhnB
MVVTTLPLPLLTPVTFDDPIYQDLTEAGHVGQQLPYDAFWGARYAVVADPEGNSVGIMSAADPARMTAGPTSP